MSTLEDINFGFEITPKEKRYHCRKISIHDFKNVMQALEAIRYNDEKIDEKYTFDWNEYLINAYRCFNVSYETQEASINGIKNGCMWLNMLSKQIYDLSFDNRNKCHEDVKKFIRKYGIE